MICYGRSVVTIGDQLYGTDDSLSGEDIIKKAQNVYDSVLKAFPNLRALMVSAQNAATTQGYVETILGRRRHLPDMQLPPFEFVALPGYINPDIDPLNPDTLKNKSSIPDRIVKQLTQEFNSYKYFGQIAKRTKELYEQKIKVINNKNKITDASRQCVNSIIQGSAADMTKMAILRLSEDPEWKQLGGRLLTPVHDELICEVPIENWQRGGERLSEIMSSAGDFLPFPINCDVETSLRWYGLSYPCPYTEPKSLNDLTTDEIKWVQYMLTEMEYDLPIIKNEDGSKPRGDAAKGVNGVITDKFKEYISDYKLKYNVGSDEEFINHIKNKVINGI